MSTADEIKTVAGALAAAINAKNPGEAAACYTEDGTLMPPGAPNQTGRAAIAAFWSGAIGAGLGDVSLETTEIFEEGGANAVEIGILRGSMAGTALTGKYVVHWTKTAEGWRLHHDIYNFDG